MITPQEITEKKFVKAVFGGYDTSAVDDFLETVTEDYATLYKDNQTLKAKIKVLVEKIEEYRSTEDSMRMALLNAQKMSDEIIAKAKTESENALNEAKQEREEILAKLDRNIVDEQKRLEIAKQETSAYVNKNREIIAKLDEVLAGIETLDIEPDSEPEPEVSEAEVKEEIIMDAVHDIDEAVSKISGEAPAEEEKTVRETVAKTFDDEGEYTSPRPKFDFENLRFGTNFISDDE